MWLNEGFAEFMPGQYWEQKAGTHTAQDYYLDEYDQFMQIDLRRRMPLAALRSNKTYPKAAIVLRMLKLYLGEKPFWASVHRYLVDHAFGNATTDDLRQAVLDATGENLDWFWDQWIYQAGYPEFTVAAKYDSTANTVTLVVQQTQQDSSKADSTGLRSTTPAAFHMPVTGPLATAPGAVTAPAPLPSPAAPALPERQAGMKAPAARVGAAAAEAVGTRGGTPAAALARQAWTGDSSDAVRAAAVVALASDSAGRRAILLQALRTPSYRDAVQNAAYRAIAQSGDTTMVDSVDAHAGDQRFAPHVLAALASRGSAHALDLLVKHLDDERPYVRRWALEAFRFSMRRELAQPKLQAVSAGLKYADTKQAAAELLQQWQKGGNDN